MITTKITSQIFLVAILIVIAGCSSVDQRDIQYFEKPDQVDVNSSSYILLPPDEIEVHCTNVPELHLKIQKIRPDGKVTFQGLGEIRAAGRTPQQLADVLEEKALMLYALTGEHPIDIRIVTFKSSWYYVMGQAYFPGAKIYTGRDTASHAIALARPSTLASLDRVLVVRPSTETTAMPKVFSFDYQRMMTRGYAQDNVLLKPNDIVYIPPTWLASIGLQIEELVRPIGRAFSTVNIVEASPGN